MIEKTTNGFLSVLGPWPVHYAMLMTFITTVSFPRVEEGKHLIIHWIWVMHLVLACVVFFNSYNILEVYNHFVNAVSMLLYAFSLILIFTDFIPYPNEVTETEEEVEEDTSSSVTPSTNEVVPDANLVFWLKFEVLIFGANLLSNIVFLMFRGCCINRIELSEKSNIKYASRDAIDKQSKLVSLVGSMLIPYMATTCFL